MPLVYDANGLSCIIHGNEPGDLGITVVLVSEIEYAKTEILIITENVLNCILMSDFRSSYAFTLNASVIFSNLRNSMKVLLD